MKKFLSSLALLSLLLANAAEKRDPSLLFQATFDGYTVNADYAAGNGRAKNENKFELNLRMFPGVKGKGNAVAMDKTEEIQWDIRKNFNPSAGTLSFWLSPVNWSVPTKSQHRFIQLYANDFNMMVMREKTSDERIILYLNSKFPGSAKAFYATAHIDPVKWSKGSWHRIDVTWDNTGMKLYVDGILQQPKSRTLTVNDNLKVGNVYPHTKFPENTRLPEKVTFGVIRAGAVIKVNPEERTAYDNIEIRNRVLSAAEILKEYQKIMPPPPKGDAVQKLNVPVSGNENIVSQVPMLNSAGDSMTVREASLSGNAYAAIRHYDGKLIVRFTSPDAPTRANHTLRDANIWEDDSFELHLKNPSGNTVYQFIVNPNGAVYDSRNAAKSWNSAATAKIIPVKNGWSAELIVPFADLGMKTSEIWEGNFGITVHQGQAASFVWSGKGFKAHGKLLISESDRAVKIVSTGTLVSGALDFGIDGTLPVKVTLTGENGLNTGFDEFRTAGTLSRKLDTGTYTVKVSDKEETFFFENTFFVSNPFEANIKCLPNHGKLNVELEFTNTGNQLNRGKCQLLSPAGKVIAETAFSSADPRKTVSFPWNKNWTSGTYTVKTTVENVALPVEKSFIIPDMTAINSNAGIDHKVPAPWIPVKVEGKNFSVWNRTYSFDQSPFTVNILAGDKKVFRSAPLLKLNGEIVRWSSFKVDSILEDEVHFSGRGSAGGAKFIWKAILAFDGLLQVDLTMEPAGKELKINSFVMDCQVDDNFAKLVRSYSYTAGIFDWKNDQVELKFSDQDCPFVWLSGVPDGFYFGFNALANWYPGLRKNAPHLTFKRQKGFVDFRAQIITEPVILKKRADYTWTLLATPTRPMPEKRRFINWGSWRMPKGINQRGMGGTTIHNYLSWEDLTSLSSLIPRDPKAMKENLLKADPGLRRPLYTMPIHLSSNDPEYDYLATETAQLPSTSSHKWTKNNVVCTNMPNCGNTAVSNVFAYRMEKLFQEMPICGLYFDIANAKTCRNTLHGHGGIDAFGQSFHTSTELPLRSFFLRTWKLAQKYDKEILLHVSAGKYTPVTHNFLHGFAPGEELYGPFAGNPDYFYCEIPAERWQTLYNPQVYGTELFFLLQSRRSALGHAHLKHRQKDFLENPEWTLRVLTPIILHDTNVWNDWVNDNTIAKWWEIREKVKLPDAVFTGYWENCPYKSSTSGVRVSLYSWKNPSPYRELIAVGNFTRKALPAGLTLEKGDYTDLWSGKKLDAGELKNLSIPANHFLIIGVK